MFTVCNSERATDDTFATADDAARVVLVRLYSTARAFEAMRDDAITPTVARGYAAAAEVCRAAAADLRAAEAGHGWCFPGVPWSITCESIGATR